MILAPVNKIIKSSVVDGPGNRCAIFLQGCNFNCMYCHNPETINNCFNCGKCIDTCPVHALSIIDNKVVWDDKKCVDCDTCIKTCDHNASPKIKYMNALGVMEVVKECTPFIKGITTSGGECSLHKDFLVELFTLAKKENLSCLIDSNGSLDYSSEDFKELIDLADGVMLDVKAINNDIHLKVIGQSNETVIKNAIFLASIGKLTEIRTVCANTYLNNEETIDSITKLLSPYLGIRDIKYRIIKYRPFGVREEYKNLGSPSDEDMNHYKEIALNNGFKDILLT